MVSRCAFAVFLACAFVVLAKAERADALDLYVDGSCSVNGNGAANQCASAAGGAGAFREPQACLSAAQAGDTCLIKNGTYTSNNMAGDPSETGGFALENSGTAGNPITIKNYPGHSPLLQNCPSSASSYSQCANPTITAFQKSYYVIEGLRIRGGIWLYGPGMSNHARGVVIRNNDISQGWGEVDDGNWAGIFVQDQTAALITGNTIHDVSVLSGGGQQSSGSCIKMYQNTDSVVEYNTCRNTRIAESQAGGIDDKAEATRNIHRFNWIENTPMCVRINNQLNSSGVQIYGNVCIGANSSSGTNTCFRLITLINGIDIYNNTCYNYRVGLEIMNEGGTVTNVRAYNNIFSNISDNNVEAYQDPTLLDFNAYWPSASAPRYRLGGAWRNAVADTIAGTNFDDHSREANCGFIAAGTDFRLSQSTCVGQGRRGGTTSGSVVDLGAYGVATCVGATCVTGGQQPPTQPSSGAPASPQNLRILSSELLRDLLLEDFAAPAPVFDQPRAQLRDLASQPIALG
jgi:hypothetical protein